MPHVYEYALVRAVPLQERGEFMNVGVLVYCAQLRFLGCRTHVDAERLAALDPALDTDSLVASLRELDRLCGGEHGGAAESPGQRFRWLTAPRSTLVQTSPVHTGFTGDPAAELDRLLRELVLAPTDRSARS